ncbi:hypothetical protein MOQ_009964, partial [Trypanosoma cruzi marinkellei]
MRGGGRYGGQPARLRRAERLSDLLSLFWPSRKRAHGATRPRAQELVASISSGARPPQATSGQFDSLFLFLSLALSGGPATDSLYRQGARQGKMLRARRCARKKDDNNSKKWEGGRGASAQPKGDFYCSVLNASLKLFGPRTTCVHRSACVFVCAGMRVARRQTAQRVRRTKKKEERVSKPLQCELSWELRPHA